MISLLAGTLNGAAVGKETIDFNACHDGVTNTGQALIAVDPDAFGERALFIERISAVVRDIQESNILPGVDRIRIPGEGADASISSRQHEGIPISRELLKALNACAVECGVPVLNF
jgi:LDH2 family malate/lactate/ureidoglycolate dehydrogenase